MSRKTILKVMSQGVPHLNFLIPRSYYSVTTKTFEKYDRHIFLKLDIQIHVPVEDNIENQTQKRCITC